jgi:galactokinase
LKRVKYGVIDAIDKIKKLNPEYSLFTTNIEELSDYEKLLTTAEIALIQANIANRDILVKALDLLKYPSFNDKDLGELLNIHQDNLREKLKISTPKIDRMIQAGLDAGALGGKINGSGGGGCMFVYAPRNALEVAKAIENQGGKAYIIRVDEGTKED